MREISRPGRRKITLLGLVITLVLVVVVVGVFVRRARPSTAPATPPAVPVVMATVAKEDTPIYLAGIGTVQAAQSVTVKARVDGQLQKVAFTEGQDVKEGAVSPGGAQNRPAANPSRSPSFASEDPGVVRELCLYICVLLKPELQQPLEFFLRRRTMHRCDACVPASGYL
jgi:hypothetical protein